MISVPSIIVILLFIMFELEISTGEIFLNSSVMFMNLFYVFRRLLFIIAYRRGQEGLSNS